MKFILQFGLSALVMAVALGQTMASSITVFHADSLAGPMEVLKTGFEDALRGMIISLRIV